MSANVDLNNRPDYDKVLQDIADYVLNFRTESAAVSYTHLTLPTILLV